MDLGPLGVWLGTAHQGNRLVPTNLQKGQRRKEKALTSTVVKELLFIITIDAFIAKFYWFIQMNSKEPLVKEKLSCIYT